MLKVTPRVMELVEALLASKYDGAVSIRKGAGYSGAAEIIKDGFCAVVTGFCKEELHVTEDTETGELLLVGRYDLLDRYDINTSADVRALTRISWGLYQRYKSGGYVMPHEFRDLYIEHGFIKAVVKTVTEFEEL